MTNAQKIELLDLQIVEGSFVDKGDNPEAHIAFFKRADDSEKAVWPSSYVNDLPDSAFLYIEGGGKKDEDGKTTPRSLRHFPVRDASGDVDAAHARNAIARAPQANVSPAIRQRVMRDARRLLAQVNKNGDYEEYQSMIDEPRTLAEVMHDDEMTETKQHLMQSVWEIVCHAEPSQWTALLSQSISDLSDVLSEMGHQTEKEQPVLQPQDENKEASASPVDDDGRKENKMTAKTTKSIDEILASLSDEDRGVIAAKLTEVETTKSASDDVTKRLVDLEKRAADAESEVAKMKDEKLTAAFVVKAKEIGGGTDVNQTAMLLKSAYGRSDEEGKALESTLRGLAAQAKLGATLFKSIGSTGEGVDDVNPDALIEADTKKIMESDPRIGYHAAYKMALSRNRDAYARGVRGVNVE